MGGEVRIHKANSDTFQLQISAASKEMS